jgi:glycosyltransferase involved in cell wall biosynthesis
MILSLITGTYNRLTYLIKMVDTFRANIPNNFDYEIIVVDGGSTDGTIRWLNKQSDIKVINHGALLGAIRAFCDGGFAASGKYVLFANDDIEFLDGSIMPAILYLEENMTCGAVAFSDNRNTPDYQIQNMSVQVNGVVTHLPYAQVGMYRKWLGDLCNWWGYGDIDANTYGGDNYLSARIYEMGYSVDAVASCKVTDLVAKDDLRQRNENIEAQRRGYYARYPLPPIKKDYLVSPNLDSKQLRVVYMPIYDPDYHAVVSRTKKGLRQALSKKSIVWEVDYLNSAYDLADICRQFQPHMILTQSHNTPIDLAPAKAVKPDVLVVNWNGDVWRNNLLAPEMLTWIKAQVDIQLTVNQSVLSEYEKEGIFARYWQIGFESDAMPISMNPYDVVFMGSNYSEKRQALGDFLKSLPYNVGLYGRNWKDRYGDTTYQFDKNASIVQNAKIVIGDNQFPDEYGFVSNRWFETLASGAFLLHQRVKGIEELTGYIDGVHYVAWDDFDDLKEKIAYWLARDNERGTIADTAYTFTRKHHSFDSRVKELSAIVKEYDQWKVKND